MGFLNFFRQVVLEPNKAGSAAFRVAAHEVQVTEAKGALIALRAAEKVTNAALDELESAAAAVHKGRDAIHSRIENLQKSLGF